MRRVAFALCLGPSVQWLLNSGLGRRFGAPPGTTNGTKAFADADQQGTRIGVPRGDAVDLRLTRIVKKAELVCVGNQAAGADMLRKGEIHAYAAPGPALMEISDQLAGTHVLDDSFSSIEFAGFIPNGHDRLVSYVSWAPESDQIHYVFSPSSAEVTTDPCSTTNGGRPCCT